MPTGAPAPGATQLGGRCLARHHETGAGEHARLCCGCGMEVRGLERPGRGRPRPALRTVSPVPQKCPFQRTNGNKRPHGHSANGPATSRCRTHERGPQRHEGRSRRPRVRAAGGRPQRDAPPASSSRRRWGQACHLHAVGRLSATEKDPPFTRSNMGGAPGTRAGWKEAA